MTLLAARLAGEMCCCHNYSNASATKCCRQPRGLISLARVPLIITCHYQSWLHLATRLSVPCMCVSVVAHQVGECLFGYRTRTSSNGKSRLAKFSTNSAGLYVHTHIYGDGINHWCPLLSGFTAGTIVGCLATCQRSVCTGALWKQRGSRASRCQTTR